MKGHVVLFVLERQQCLPVVASLYTWHTHTHTHIYIYPWTGIDLSFLTRNNKLCLHRWPKSTQTSLDFGLPQGPVLGSVLFTLYTTPVTCLITLCWGLYCSLCIQHQLPASSPCAGACTVHFVYNTSYLPHRKTFHSSRNVRQRHTAQSLWIVWKLLTWSVHFKIVSEILR